MSKSFSLLATVTASTKRAPAIVGGKRGTLVTNIASLKCLPLDPVSAEIRQRLALETPHEVLQTSVDASLDIIEGDILTVDGTDYPIRACEDWYWRPTGETYRRLYLENLKR